MLHELRLLKLYLMNWCNCIFHVTNTYSRFNVFYLIVWTLTRAAGVVEMGYVSYNVTWILSVV